LKVATELKVQLRRRRRPTQPDFQSALPHLLPVITNLFYENKTRLVTFRFVIKHGADEERQPAAGEQKNLWVALTSPTRTPTYATKTPGSPTSLTITPTRQLTSPARDAIHQF
jgi:hypothetical protein